MPRDRRRRDYLRDRADRRSRSGGRRDREDRGYYPMEDYEYDRARGRSDYARRGDYRDQDYADYDFDMRGDYGDYRGDYARRGVGRPREYDRRDYADDDLAEEYEDDLKKWTEKLKKYDRFGLPKEQAIQKAKQMGVTFKDYSEEEFYAIYLMHISDYPQIANEPNTYLAMAKSWLEDKDLKIDPSEKVCIYLYEIVMTGE